MQSIQNAPLPPGTRVFVRCDIDVPVEDKQIKEPFRLESILPTLSFLKSKNVKIIIAGHMGEDQSTSILKPFFDEKLGKDSYQLLENLRFNEGEKNNTESFAQELAQTANLYVNESFATSHRKHASIVTLPTLLPAYAGYRLEQEVNVLSGLLKNPKRPLITVVGGAKIESKLPVINKFLQFSDAVLLGGKLGMEWTEPVPQNLFIPKDYIDNLDIGPKTIQGYKHIISTAATVIWAGPMGLYEKEEYLNGTQGIAEAIIESQAYSVVGGGDTIAALNKLDLLDKMSFESTGGGAMLDFLVKGTLPGLEVLGYHA